VFFEREVAPAMAALQKENRKQYQVDKGYYAYLGGVRKSCEGKGESCTLESQLSDAKMTALFEKVADYNTRIISTIYEELNVLLSRSSFLANRISVFVEADFYNQLKTDKNISQFEKDFYSATGLSAYQSVLNMFQNNPEIAKADIRQAMALHKSSLDALEVLFKNSMAQHIARLRLISQNESATPNAIGFDSLGRLLYDTDPSADHPTDSPAIRRLKQKERSSWDLFAQSGRAVQQLIDSAYTKFFQSGRYETPFELPIHERRTSPTDEFNSHRDVYRKLCIQALAFNDQSVFLRDCSDAVLQSVFHNSLKDSVPEQLKVFLEKSKVVWLEKQKEGIEHFKNPKEFQKYNHSVRICAYRDFLRNSRVAYLTSAQNVTQNTKATNTRVDAMIQKMIDHDTEVEKEEEAQRKQRELEAQAMTQAAQVETEMRPGPGDGPALLPRSADEQL
jgi:hypothetical protein